MKANIIKKTMIAALTVSLALTPSMGVFASGEVDPPDAESGSDTGTGASESTDSKSHSTEEEVLELVNQNLGTVMNEEDGIP